MQTKFGYVIADDIVDDQQAVARVAPITHAHVNSLGRYDLHRQPPPAGHLRPLRRVVDDADRVVLTPPLGASDQWTPRGANGGG